jgi:hypothetical protein
LKKFMGFAPSDFERPALMLNCIQNHKGTYASFESVRFVHSRLVKQQVSSVTDYHLSHQVCRAIQCIFKVGFWGLIEWIQGISYVIVSFLARARNGASNQPDLKNGDQGRKAEISTKVEDRSFETGKEKCKSRQIKYKPIIYA